MSNAPPFPILDPTPKSRCADIGPGDPIPASYVRLKDFGEPAANYLGYAARKGYVPAAKVRRTDGDRNGPVYVHRLAAMHYLNRVHPYLVPAGPAAGGSPLFQGLRRWWNRLIGRAPR